MLQKNHFVHNYVSFLLNAILPALFLAMSYSQTSSDLRVLTQVPSRLTLAMLHGPMATLCSVFKATFLKIKG